MRFKFKSFRILICCLFLSGCLSSQYVEDVNEVIANSPKIELLAKEKYQARTPPEQIALFYKYWNPLTRPDAVKDWKYLYVMGETSSPDWSYSKISEVAVSQRWREDNLAVAELREIASKQGGDGLIDLWREPLIDAPKFGARIVGFRYHGTVVRKN